MTSVVSRVALALALVLPLGSAVAQTIPVRSGEHADFTRLVLDIGAARTWQLTDTGSERLLTLSPPVDGFDIATVFDLIPRLRLARLTVQDGLLLSLACDCEVSSTRYRDRYLVIDIALRGPDEAIAPSARRPTASPRSTATGLPDLTRLLAGGEVPDALSQAPFVRLDPAVSETIVSESMRVPSGVPLTPESPILGTSETLPQEVDLAEVARIMSEQLARAAASGLLQPSPTSPRSAPDATVRADPTNSEPAVERADPTSVQPPPEQFPGVPIRAETALDAAMRRLPVTGLQRNQLSCQGDAISMRNWSTGEGVDQGLGSLRMALYDDRDNLQQNAVVALAQHYLYYGFGAEAAHWLGQLDAPPPDLLVLAALVDETESARFSPEPDPVLCSEEELLWRYLDGAIAVEAMTADEVGRVQRAAAALPGTLRDQIVPRIARRLHGDGHAEAARNLRDLIRRGGRLSSTVLLQLDLDLGLVGGGDPEVGAALAAAMRDDGGDPVSIMAHALAFDRGQRVVPSETRLGAAEALLRETGIGAGTAALWLEVMLANAAAGSMDRVLSLLTAPGMPASEREAAMTSLLAERLTARDTTALHALAYLHGANWRADGSTAGRIRVGVVTHLREVGLNDAANALELGQPPLILPERPSVPPTDAELLSSAWQTNDWETLSVLASGPHRNVALRMSDQGVDVASTGPVLDLPDVAAQLADSRDLRAAVAQLLAAPVPELPEAAE